MKKYVLVSALFVSAITSSVAQSNNFEAGTFSLGIKGGVNFSTLNGNPEGDISGNSIRWQDVDKGMITGFNIGVLANYAVTDIFSIQPELLYSRMGVKYDYNKGGYVAHITDNFNYLQVPLLAKFSFGTDVVKFNIHLGPYVSFATGGTRQADYSWDFFGSNVSDNETYDLDVKKGGIHGVDVGVSAGIGLSFVAGPGNIFIDARYNYGFLTVYDKDNNNNTSNNNNNQDLFEGLYPDNSLTNGTINLGLGYMVAIGGK